MPQRPVLVVRQMFAFQGRHLNPGDIITDKAEMDVISATQPDKVTRSSHDYAEPEPSKPAVVKTGP